MLITSVDRIWKFLTARFGTPFNIIYHDTKRSGVQPKEIWVFRQYRIPMETQKAPALGPAYQGAPWGLCWCIQKGIKGKRERKKMKQNEIWKKKRQGNRREGVGGKQVWSKQWCVQMNEWMNDWMNDWMNEWYSKGSLKFYCPQDYFRDIWETRDGPNFRVSRSFN